MTPGSAIRAGSGASVGATDPGYVALTLYRHGNKIMASDREPKCKRSKSSKDQHGERGDQDQATEARYHQEKNLPFRVKGLDKGRATPGRKQPKCPGRACQDLHGQGTRHQPPPRPTSWISAVSSRKVIKWQPLATWQPLSTRKPTEDTRPMTCRTSRHGAGKVSPARLVGQATMRH